MTRRMSIGPTGPREMNGMRGWGFTITFEDNEPAANPAEGDIIGTGLGDGERRGGEGGNTRPANHNFGTVPHHGVIR